MAMKPLSLHTLEGSPDSRWKHVERL